MSVDLHHSLAMDIAQPSRDDFSSCLNYLHMYDESSEVPRRSPRRPKVMPLADFDMDSLDKDSAIPMLHDPLDTDYTIAIHSSNRDGSEGSSRNSSSRSSLFSLENDTTVSSREPLKSALVEEYLDEIDMDDEICCVDNVVTIVKCHDQGAARRVAFVTTQ